MKKQIISICLIAFLGSLQLLNAQDRISNIRDILLNPNSEKVLVVSHRGDWRGAPENSLAAIENAIKMKVDVVEIDLKRTKDGHLVLMHDATIDRTSMGQGKVSDWTLDSIKTLVLRNGCRAKTRQRIPTLEEAMLTAKGKIMVNLDHADSFFDEVYAVLEKTGTTNQVIMKGSQPVETVKAKFGKYLDKVIYMPIVNLEKPEAEEMIQSHLEQMCPVAFELVYSKASNPLPMKMKDLLKGKTLIWYNTMPSLAGGYDDEMALESPEKSYGYLVNELNARMLQTDRPEYLLEYLRKIGRHD